jgi:hypothetical protein
MKALLIFPIILFLSLSSFSQLTKNNWLVGGSGSFYSYKQTYNSPVMNTDFNYKSINVLASVGYFFVNKAAIGLRPGFYLLKGEDETNSITTNNKKYSIGPFARYYFLNTEKPFNILSDISYQFGINDQHKGWKGKYNTLCAMAGPEIFFNSAVGMEVLLGYRSITETVHDLSGELYYSDKRTGFMISVGFQFHLEKE